MSEETGHSIMIQAKILPNGTGLCFSLPYITQEIPAGIVFKAMGYNDDEQIRKILIETDINRKFVNDIIQDAKIIDTKDALTYIVDKAIDYKLGARGLRSICEEILNDAMFNLPGSDIKKLVVSKKYVTQQLSRISVEKLKAAS